MSFVNDFDTLEEKLESKESLASVSILQRIVWTKMFYSMTDDELIELLRGVTYHLGKRLDDVNGTVAPEGSHRALELMNRSF